MRACVPCVHSCTRFATVLIPPSHPHAPSPSLSQAKSHGERPMLKLMKVLGEQLDKKWVPGGM